MGEIIRCVNRNESLILVGDFNVHHTAWNCDNIDVNGERMLEEFEDEDMFVVNYDNIVENRRVRSEEFESRLSLM